MGFNRGRRGAPLAPEIRRCRRGVVAGAFAVALVVGSAGPGVVAVGAQDETGVFSTAAVVPDDALAYLNVPLDEASPQWETGRELLDRSGLGEVLAEAEAEMDGLPLDAFLGGEAGVVVTEAALDAVAAAGAGELTGGFMPGADASPVASSLPLAAQGWAVVLDARAPDTAYAGLVASLEDQAGDVVEVDYEGVTISYVEPAAAGTAEAETDDTPLAVARIDDLVLIAGAPADLEPLIDTAQGSTPSLAETAPFTSITAALPGEYLILGFVNEAAVSEARSTLTGLPIPANLIGSERSSGFVVQADQPGFRMETVAIGAEVAAGAAPFESALLTRTPSDALFFLSATDLGATGALQTLG
ncbi:MAG: DUF3352 domain-containing protein, partial [Chloroflexia bacterium]|nr:DUF3352 domain-containing protein [Chloroflexia bacterium]